MSQEDIAMLKTVFDELEETNGDDELRNWLSSILDLKSELARFVAEHRKGGEVTEYVGFLKGSFNFSFRYRFNDDGPDAIIRFPKPGHTCTTLRDEKVTNEVRFLEYFSKNTTIPLPRIHGWGLTAESPNQLGPFIIMDFVEGTSLTTVLQTPRESSDNDVVLNPKIDDKILDKVYLQIADFLLQLSRLEFSSIGAISENGNSNSWSVTGRPLTYNMNELASVSGYPTRQFPIIPFDHASDYLKSLTQEHLIHLQTQRNIAYDSETARKRFIARHRIAKLISKYSVDASGPFLPFCDDLRPANMLVDPHNFQITAVIDMEYTNAMPAQFKYDPPWWLLLTGSEMWLERSAMDEFVALYKPRMEQYLGALEQVERTQPLSNRTGPALFTRMRESWESGRFWFDYAIRKSFELDIVYWSTLHDHNIGTDVKLLDDHTYEEMQSFVQKKMEQLKAYKQECSA